MEPKSGKLIIDNIGRLILTGEVFDEHGSYNFNAYVDTGNSLNLVLTKGLADAVCAQVEDEVNNISVGAGSDTITGQICRTNLRFGNLELKNYRVTVVDGTRNLVGIKFFQNAGLIMLIDFHKGKTMGGLISNDRKFARALGKTTHCLSIHNNDLSKSDEPCLTCGALGE